jgi:hypothetical protein
MSEPRGRIDPVQVVANLKITRKVMQKFVTSLVRHGLTALGGALTGAGVIANPEQVNDTSMVVVGVVMYAIGQLLSLRKAKQEVEAK